MNGASANRFLATVDHRDGDSRTSEYARFKSVEADSRGFGCGVEHISIPGTAG